MSTRVKHIQFLKLSLKGVVRNSVIVY